MRRNQAPQKTPFLSKSLKISIGLHLALVIFVFFQGALSSLFYSSSKEEKEALKNAQIAKQAIRVDMVDLPRYKLNELNQIDPTQEIGEDALKETENFSDPVVSETAMKLKDDAQAKADKEKAELEKKAKLSKRDKEKLATEEKKRLEDLRARMRADARRQELVGKLKGGRDILAGNQLSKGYSQTGSIATSADEYVGLLRSHVHQNWQVPSWMKASALKAVMLVKIAPDGSLKEKSFLKKSGNLSFDSTVEAAIEKANPFPAPPKSLARMYMEDGFECGFPN